MRLIFFVFACLIPLTWVEAQLKEKSSSIEFFPITSSGKRAKKLLSKENSVPWSKKSWVAATLYGQNIWKKQVDAYAEDLYFNLVLRERFTRMARRWALENIDKEKVKKVIPFGMAEGLDGEIPDWQIQRYAKAYFKDELWSLGQKKFEEYKNEFLATQYTDALKALLTASLYQREAIRHQLNRKKSQHKRWVQIKTAEHQSDFHRRLKIDKSLQKEIQANRDEKAYRDRSMGYRSMRETGYTRWIGHLQENVFHFDGSVESSGHYEYKHWLQRHVKETLRLNLAFEIARGKGVLATEWKGGRSVYIRPRDLFERYTDLKNLGESQFDPKKTTLDQVVEIFSKHPELLSIYQPTKIHVVSMLVQLQAIGRYTQGTRKYQDRLKDYQVMIEDGSLSDALIIGLKKNLHQVEGAVANAIKRNANDKKKAKRMLSQQRNKYQKIYKEFGDRQAQKMVSLYDWALAYLNVFIDEQAQSEWEQIQAPLWKSFSVFVTTLRKKMSSKVYLTSVKNKNERIKNLLFKELSQGIVKWKKNNQIFIRNNKIRLSIDQFFDRFRLLALVEIENAQLTIAEKIILDEFMNLHVVLVGQADDLSHKIRAGYLDIQNEFKKIQKKYPIEVRVVDYGWIHPMSAAQKDILSELMKQDEYFNEAGGRRFGSLERSQEGDRAVEAFAVIGKKPHRLLSYLSLDPNVQSILRSKMRQKEIHEREEMIRMGIFGQMLDFDLKLYRRNFRELEKKASEAAKPGSPSHFLTSSISLWTDDPDQGGKYVSGVPAMEFLLGDDFSVDTLPSHLWEAREHLKRRIAARQNEKKTDFGTISHKN